MKTIYKLDLKKDDWGNFTIEIIVDGKYYYGNGLLKAKE